MYRMQSVLLFMAITMASALVGFAQAEKDEQAPIVAPAPRVIKYCLARMINENKSMELLACSQLDTDSKTFYDVSLPVILNEGKVEYRTEQREITRRVTSFRYSYCELDASTLAAYQPDGTRLTAKEVADLLQPTDLPEYTPVVLSDALPDDLMATVLVDDCIVIVVPDGGLEFQVRSSNEN